MKKCKWLWMLVVVTLALTGCKGKEDTTEKTTKAPATTKEQTTQTATEEEHKIPSMTGEMRGISATEIVSEMKIGWNLGNTLEACGNIDGKSTYLYETAWGNPVITEKIFIKLKEKGFSSVRIPVAWSNMIDEDHTINPLWMDRVQTVVNYAMKQDLYVVLNIHWDGGWFEGFSTEYTACKEKYVRIWEQISERFKDYSDYLIFESLNEEAVFDDIWNRYSGKADDKKKQAYNLVNTINQVFVDTVRASGGNNESRHLLIAGYATDIDMTIDPLYKMPEDKANEGKENKLIVSVHYYTPSTFAILEKDESWGKAAYTWGTDEEIAELKKNFDKMKTAFVDKGYPVIIGEYGAPVKSKDIKSVALYFETCASYALELGFCPMLWDTGQIISRNSGNYLIEEIKDVFTELTK